MSMENYRKTVCWKPMKWTFLSKFGKLGSWLTKCCACCCQLVIANLGPLLFSFRAPANTEEYPYKAETSRLRRRFYPIYKEGISNSDLVIILPSFSSIRGAAELRDSPSLSRHQQEVGCWFRSGLPSTYITSYSVPCTLPCRHHSTTMKIRRPNFELVPSIQ